MPLLGRAKIVGLARAITSRRREPFDSGKDAVRKVEEKNPLGGGRVLGRSMRDELERGGALACRLPLPVRIAEGDLARGPDGVPLWARRRLWLMAADVRPARGHADVLAGGYAARGWSAPARPSDAFRIWAAVASSERRPRNVVLCCTCVCHAASGRADDPPRYGRCPGESVAGVREGAGQPDSRTAGPRGGGGQRGSQATLR